MFCNCNFIKKSLDFKDEKTNNRIALIETERFVIMPKYCSLCK